jgi:hypothetical protein
MSLIDTGIKTALPKLGDGQKCSIRLIYKYTNLKRFSQCFFNKKSIPSVIGGQPPKSY